MMFFTSILLIFSLLNTINSFFSTYQVKNIPLRQLKFFSVGKSTPKDLLASGDLKPGSIVEYFSSKGSKQIALVKGKKKNGYLDVINEAKKDFSISIYKISYLVTGEYTFGDLLRIKELISEFRPHQVEKLWEKTQKQGPDSILNVTFISKFFYNSDDPIRRFVSGRLMSSFGSTYFVQVPQKDDGRIDEIGLKNEKITSENRDPLRQLPKFNYFYDEIFYKPIDILTVRENIQDLVALKEFKTRYLKFITKGLNSSNENTTEENKVFISEEQGQKKLIKNDLVLIDRLYTIKGSISPSSNIALFANLPYRVEQVLLKYTEGLKHIVIKSHPWLHPNHAKTQIGLKTKTQNWSSSKTKNGFNKPRYGEIEGRNADSIGKIEIKNDLVMKGNELLDFLNIPATAKNARSLLEAIGIWSEHENLEKYIMNIKDEFPDEVLNEVDELIEKSDVLEDFDERIRRDLRHLDSYAIDREGASEVDDALSLEYLEDGSEKIWIHIADVSRWIRPGSFLSLEAEKRMSSLYMPDERISMFPEKLSQELLSLGAQKESSFAVSCGVTLNDDGKVISYEICPTKIKLSKRITYNQLDDILNKKPEKNEKDNEFVYEPQMINDLQKLNFWAIKRHQYRNKLGALDQYLRHKTELYLSVKSKSKGKMLSLLGSASWSNSSSVCTVSEFMILMCDTVGLFCDKNQVPVWFKTQPYFPDRNGNVNENIENTESSPFYTAASIMRHLRAAEDSLVPGPHKTSGSEAYVQCTSPIRRYHDLYNHYRLKATLHAASLGEDWVHRAEEEAGIQLLDRMATAEQRLNRLQSIRMVTRERFQYWFHIFLKCLVNTKPLPTLNCIIITLPDQLPEPRNQYQKPKTQKNLDYVTYEVIILQLGSFNRYKFIYPLENTVEGDKNPEKMFKLGEMVEGNLFYRPQGNHFVVMPENLKNQEILKTFGVST